VTLADDAGALDAPGLKCAIALVTIGT